MVLSTVRPRACASLHARGHACASAERSCMRVRMRARVCVCLCMCACARARRGSLDCCVVAVQRCASQCNTGQRCASRYNAVQRCASQYNAVQRGATQRLDGIELLLAAECARVRHGREARARLVDSGRVRSELRAERHHHVPHGKPLSLSGAGCALLRSYPTWQTWPRCCRRTCGSDAHMLRDSARPPPHSLRTHMECALGAARSR